MKRTVLAICCLVPSLLPSLAGATVSKGACVDANAEGQQFESEGKLSLARERYQLCSDPSCPKIVHDDCVKRMNDVVQAQPSMVFEVKDASGADVTDVVVAIDGKTLVSHLDGTPIPVDVGNHVFSFTTGAGAVVTRTLLIREGEPRRHERIVLPSTSPAPASVASVAPLEKTSPPPPLASPPSSEATSPLKPVGFAIAGVGVALAGVGGVFVALSHGRVEANDMACPGGVCSASSQSALSALSSQVTNNNTKAATFATLAIGGFALGGVAALTGITLALTAPHGGEPAVSVTPTVGLGTLGLAGTF